jgi:hypothetical protein
MLRFIRVLSLVAVVLVVAPPATSVASTGLDADLATIWTKVFVTPGPQNPFGTGGAASACWNLGNRTLAPFGPSGVPSCIVTAGTAIFVAASSFECSTFEGNGTTEAELKACALQHDAQVAPAVTIDGAPVVVAQAETGLLSLALPADNIFGQPAGTLGSSYGHGWVALLHPLTPGTHKIVSTGSAVFTTEITVRPGV